jgi:hypothetical protein
MELNPNNYQYQFTRHLASCNNINEGKRTIKSLGFVEKDYEPSAALYGIMKTIEFSQDPSNSDSYKFNHVYVSNLIRTWITSVLLYGTHNPEELNLYISPFLKEKHEVILGKRIERGNFPKEIYHTANKFQKFLTTLYDLSDDTNLPKKYYSNLPKIINVVLPVKKDGSKQMIVFEKQENGYQIQNENVCSMEDNAGPFTKEEDGFIIIGNLQKFMEWFESEKNYHGKNHEQGLVHVVTHSQIMQQYLREKFNFDIDKLDDYKNVRKSNTWRFKTRKTINDSELVNMIQNGQESQQKVPILIPGVPLDKEEAIMLEGKLHHLSLCGTSGSVESLCKKGGKYSKKNRKQKTKKLKNRKSKTNKKHKK